MLTQPPFSFYVDFETYYDDECSVKTLGPVAYTHHPAFETLLMSVVIERPNEPSSEWVGEPNDFDWVWFSSYCKQHNLKYRRIAHNASFDKAVWEHCVKHLSNWFENWLDLIFVPDWHCSASVAAFCGYERSLASAIKGAYGEILDKGVRDRMKGLRAADIKKKGWWDDFREYGLKDSVWGYKLYMDHIGIMPPQWEVELMEHTVRAANYGVALDMEYLTNANRSVQAVKDTVEAQLPWVEQGEKPGSVRALAQWCNAAGIIPPTTTADGAPEFDQWVTENEGGVAAPWVKALKNWRKSNRILKLTETLQKRSVNGIFSYGLKYYGAHTGRWSGDGGFNMQNMPKFPYPLACGCDKCGSMELFENHSLNPDGNPYCSQCNEGEATWQEQIDIRGNFIARPGHKLVCCDYNQIEARVLPWLAGDEKLLQLIREGYGVYEAHAKTTMAWTGEPGTLKKTDPKKYAFAKARVLALGFQCGAERFIDMAWQYALLRISLVESKQTVASYRSSNPLIPKFWAECQNDMLRSIRQNSDDKYYEIELPSGRPLRYFNVGLSGGSIVATATVTGHKIHLYGGLLAENITQAVARDIMGQGALRVEKETGHRVLFSVHDEVVTEVPLDFDGRIIKEILEVNPDWCPDLPLGVDLDETLKYRK